MGRRYTGNPQNHEEDKFAAAPREGTLSRADINAEYLDHARLENHARARKPKVVCDCGNGAGGLYAPEFLRPHRLRGDRALQRAGRQFPEPPPRPDEAREPSEAHRDGARNGRGFRRRLRRRRRQDRRRRRARRGDMGRQADGALLDRDTAEAPGRGRDMRGQELDGPARDDRKVRRQAALVEGGHSLVKAKMREEHALFSGEVSGHMFFADGVLRLRRLLYAAGRLARIFSNDGRKLSEIMEKSRFIRRR